MNSYVNLTALREITGGDADLERELFRTFIESSMECITALKAGCEPGKEDEWRNQAHAFKGTSRSLGAERLGDLCMEAQDNCKAPAEKKLEMIAAIESEFGRVREFLESLLASRP